MTYDDWRLSPYRQSLTYNPTANARRCEAARARWLDVVEAYRAAANKLAMTRQMAEAEGEREQDQ